MRSHGLRARVALRSLIRTGSPPQKGFADSDVADLVEAHRGSAQGFHVPPVGDGLLPAAALQIVVDCVFSVVEFTGQEIFEGTSPDRAHEQVFANGRDDIIDLKAGFLAGGH